MEPRVVLVSRENQLDAVVSNYGNLKNAEFSIASSARVISQDDMEPQAARIDYAGGHRMLKRSAPTRAEQSRSSLTLSQTRQQRQDQAYAQVRRAIPDHWRHTAITRQYLDRFVFEDDDIIAVVGQDGLVANVAKYLQGQVVVGFNPDIHENPGLLVQWTPAQAPDAFAAAAQRLLVTQRTMVRATLDNDQTLDSLNEVFIGHTSHQSARYELRTQLTSERQSSSGVIVTTGTGATGWASSITAHLTDPVELPRPGEPRLTFLVREPWGMSDAYGTGVRFGTITQTPLVLTSEMEHGGTVFGDGIEADHLDFPYGRVLHIGISPRQLHLLERDRT